MADEETKKADPFKGFVPHDTSNSVLGAGKDEKPVSAAEETTPKTEEGQDNETTDTRGESAGGEDDPLAQFRDHAGEPDGSEVDSGDEDAGDDEDAAEADDGADSDDADPVEARARKLAEKFAQKRIAELTKLRREAERKSAELEERLSRLEKGAPAGEKDEQKSADSAGSPAKPDPSDEKYKYGEVDPDYLADVVKFNTEKVLAEREAEAEEKRQRTAAEQELQKVHQGWQALSERGATDYDDFEEVVIAGAQADAWALSDFMAKLIPGSDVGHEIAYHLAKNPKESVRVASLSQTEQAIYFGRLESAITASKKRAQTPRTPKAAPPSTARVRGQGGKFANPAQADFKTFEAHLKTQNKL